MSYENISGFINGDFSFRTNIHEILYHTDYFNCQGMAVYDLN